MQRAPAMHKSGKRKPGRYDLRFCIQLALAACISFCTKITVRFKLNLKTDGLACKIIFKIGGQFERLHSTRKQCRRIYICLFCVAKYLLGTPKPVNCIRWMQAAFPDSTRFFALREWTIPPGVPVHRLPAQEQSDPTGHCILPDNAVGTNWSHTPRS